jgi:very-short-patch-repair endonuclease
MTGAELILWSRLRRHQLGGHKFRRQVPLGRYVVDFACFASRLVIEIDGPAHDFRVESDAVRDAYLERLGFRLIRIPADDILQRLDDVLEAIVSRCA